MIDDGIKDCYLVDDISKNTIYSLSGDEVKDDPLNHLILNLGE